LCACGICLLTEGKMYYRSKEQQKTFPAFRAIGSFRLLAV